MDMNIKEIDTQKNGIVPLPEPMYPLMLSYADRITTFEYFPKILKCLVNQICEAGLFYNGHSDWASCYQCGVVIGEWKLDDDPFLDHSVHAPNCYLTHIWIEKTKPRDRPPLVDSGPSAEKMGKGDEDKVDDDKVDEAKVKEKEEEEEKEEEKEENLQETDDIESNSQPSAICIVCTVNIISKVFFPCGHLSCTDCLLKLKTRQCFICREPIEATKTIYYS